MKRERVFTNGKIVTREEVFAGTVRVVDEFIRDVDPGTSGSRPPWIWKGIICFPD